MSDTKRLLVVVRWPLGGIRTYMRYVYGQLGSDWDVTVVTIPTQETEALKNDAIENGYKLIIARKNSLRDLLLSLIRTIHTSHYNVIQSHGFTTAIISTFANFFKQIPHILTVHGVLEERLLEGMKGRLRFIATAMAIRNVDVIYCVGEDILTHLLEKTTFLRSGHPRCVVINNGIDPRLVKFQSTGNAFRNMLDINNEVFLFGFLGRHMPQKGFDTLIQALAIMENRPLPRDYLLVALGSGDYLQWHMELAKKYNVSDRIRFIPFQRDVAEAYQAIDTVVMPSRWEAYSLVAAETLCFGKPLIASNCIGLREVVKGSPTIVIQQDDPIALSDAMSHVILDNYEPAFTSYQNLALERYDVRHTISGVRSLLEDTIRTNSQRQTS